jgi:hypothetical protein
MYVTLVAGGVATEKVEVFTAFDIPNVDALATFDSHRERPVVFTNFCFIEGDYLLVCREHRL